MRPMTRIVPALLVLPLVGVIPAAADAVPGPDAQECEVQREIERELDAVDLTGVLIDAEAGSLDVVGADVDRVRVHGVICASDEGLADNGILIVERRRDAAWIEVDLPDHGWRGDYVRMDLRVEMPRTLAADIRDGSGGARVTGIAAARIDDGSGDVYVEDIAGAVQVDDGTGEIEIRGVGSVRYRDVEGRVSLPL